MSRYIGIIIITPQLQTYELLNATTHKDSTAADENLYLSEFDCALTQK